MSLLTIEQNFLNLPQVKDALNLTEVKRTQRNINNAHKSKFNHTMKLTALIKSAVEWFESEEGKDALREEGIEWNKEDFGKKVFGYQKSFFYKLIKVSNLDERILEVRRSVIMKTFHSLRSILMHRQRSFHAQH